MLPKSPRAQTQEYPYQANAGAYNGDLGSSRSPTAYANETQPQQYGYGQQSGRSASQGYEASVNSLPSYHTSAPARKPVNGSWRDI